MVEAGPGVAESIAVVAAWWFHPTVDLIGNTYTDGTRFTIRCRDKHDGFRFLDNIYIYVYNSINIPSDHSNVTNGFANVMIFFVNHSMD